MGIVLAQLEATGFGGTAGKLVSLVILLGALTVLLRWWWQQRGR